MVEREDGVEWRMVVVEEGVKWRMVQRDGVGERGNIYKSNKYILRVCM